MRKEFKLNSKTSIGVLLSFLIAAMLITSINACGFLASASWKEEVKLSDGRVIVVKRRIIREGGGGELASNPTLSKPKEYRISFANPDGSGNQIEWRSTKKSPRKYPEIPLILDLESGQPVIFSSVYINIGCEIYSKYIYRNGAWIEEALPEQFEMRPANLFIKLGTDMPRFVNLETKRKGNAEIGYRQSLRQVGPTRKVCG